MRCWTPGCSMKFASCTRAATFIRICLQCAASATDRRGASLTGAYLRRVSTGRHRRYAAVGQEADDLVALDAECHSHRADSDGCTIEPETVVAFRLSPFFRFSHAPPGPDASDRSGFHVASTIARRRLLGPLEILRARRDRNNATNLRSLSRFHFLAARRPCLRHLERKRTSRITRLCKGHRKGSLRASADVPRRRQLRKRTCGGLPHVRTVHRSLRSVQKNGHLVSL